ncbi:probable protein ABIL1 isoform X3 [Phoenix dactylifera]|uniref:Probable protein ABIL1 isoform X3 n=1 Tax=Phoenix dactylifera TaxID=42345 RepID=A0A8B7CM43_PHODC|nr:probable protein ABIL1 isoform X3 [Phoenix dactylifera]
MQQWRPENAAMTFDEVSMERSKSFVKALQELKNLRPQLYSAAEYCEKSYLHNEQKQMVLDNLKDYAVQAIVNAVDHLGTVAYKLTDLFEQQTLDVSTAELKISCLNQQILTCQTYTDKEGLRQQRMFTNTARHHKHYILPDSVSRRMQSCSQLQIDANLIHVQAKPRPDPPGSPASKTLSWLLASETNSASDGAPREVSGTGDAKAPKITSEVFHLLNAEDAAAPMPLSTHLRSASSNPTSYTALHSFGIRDPVEPSKPLITFRSFDNPGRLQIYRPPVRSKSLLSAFFAKNKSLKPRKASVL